MKNYYNTNRLTGSALLEAIHAAKSQQEKILLWFQAMPGRRMAPHQIRATLFSEQTPLTSIRRAMTNLEQDGFLTKTKFMIDGDFGKPVHTWELNYFDSIKPEQRKLF
jgi:hypothetical protein